MIRTRTRTPTLDQACAEAVELARAAAEELAHPSEVGEHLGYDVEAERLVTHYFECLDLAYRGWRWAVTVARAARAKVVTVDETLLLPGSDALLAPDWVPWSERLQPGDLGVGDLLPSKADDDRLVPGLRRSRVLSPIGRDLAVRRWYSGESGPHTPLAHAAPAQCSTCGFYWGLAGSLGQMFGVCANEYAPDDGRVVSVDHGCGAHSEAVVAAEDEPVAPIVDDLGYDLLEAEGSVPTAAEGSVDESDTEPLGHS